MKGTEPMTTPHEHSSMLTYTFSGGDPADSVEMHRCGCGAAGSSKRGGPIAWFYEGTLYHRCDHCESVKAKLAAVLREVEEWERRHDMPVLKRT
jgi:hypothetical protein